MSAIIFISTIVHVVILIAIYNNKTPYHNGTTHVFFDPVDFIGKLAALVPPSRLNLTRFYGVFAPNESVRAEVIALKRGKNSPRLAKAVKDSNKPYYARSMSWAQRFKRVFNIDVTICEVCQSNNAKIIACITPGDRSGLLSSTRY